MLLIVSFERGREHSGDIHCPGCLFDTKFYMYVCMCMFYMQFNIPSLLDVWEMVPASECMSQDRPAGKGRSELELCSDCC